LSLSAAARTASKTAEYWFLGSKEEGDRVEIERLVSGEIREESSARVRA
jgi:hypothetical protein